MPQKEYLVAHCNQTVKESEPKPDLKVVINRNKLNFRCPYLERGTMRCIIPGNPICTIKEAFVSSGAVQKVELTIRTHKRPYTRKF